MEDSPPSYEKSHQKVAKVKFPLYRKSRTSLDLTEIDVLQDLLPKDLGFEEHQWASNNDTTVKALAIAIIDYHCGWHVEYYAYNKKGKIIIVGDCSKTYSEKQRLSPNYVLEKSFYAAFPIGEPPSRLEYYKKSCKTYFELDGGKLKKIGEPSLGLDLVFIGDNNKK